MKIKLLLIVISITLLLLVLATAVLAQEEPPPPYTGLKNPFPWSDTSAQEAGKGLYQRSCSGCHGATGANIAGADFSTADFPQRLEERPDFYFWILSEGRINQGMPPFQSSLSEEQRWQALTYLWSLGAAALPEVTPPPAEPPTHEEEGTLLLTAPEQAQSGQPLTITTSLQDSEGKPIENATIKFFVKVNFFADGLMEIGEAVTNDQGVIVFEYIPRLTGDIQITAIHQGETHEAAITVNLEEVSEAFYHSKAGLPTPGKDLLFIGPKSATELGEEGAAPMTALRIPGGLRSLLLLAYVFAVILVWGFYLRVMYLTLRISLVTGRGDTDTRLVPLIGIAVMIALVTLLVLILITGPYSHFQLPR
jgi:mono/diheme cytochrome c family protein